MQYLLLSLSNKHLSTPTPRRNRSLYQVRTARDLPPPSMPTKAELRAELGKRKLSTDGLKAVLEERLESAKTEEVKRTKSTINGIADEYVCMITHELPIDPVTAQDSRIYEKSAIQRWLSEHRRSPATGAPMGTALLPAPQARNTIERLVQSGLIEGDKAESWRKKIRAEEKEKELRAKAEGGDVAAMRKLAHKYSKGDGLDKDMKQARAWRKRGAELNDVRAMASYGEYLLHGFGGEALPAHGLVYTTRAAEAGSDLAAFLLGRSYLQGKYGLPQDTAQAKFWLLKIVNNDCSLNVKHLKSEWRTTKVPAMLAQLGVRAAVDEVDDVDNEVVVDDGEGED